MLSMSLLNKEVMNKSREIIQNKGFVGNEDYKLGYQNDWNINNQEVRVLIVTLPFSENIQSNLNKLGWKTESKYENNGSPSFFCSELHCNEFELSGLVG